MSPGEQTQAPASVMVVEDDARMLDILRRHLEQMGYQVRATPSASAALLMLEESPSDVILSDVRMPGMDGRTLLQIVRERYPATRLVLMTAFGSVEDAVESMRAGAYSYVTKPFKIGEVAAVLRSAAREAVAARASRRPKGAAGGPVERLIGASVQMEAVRRAVLEAGEFTATVLVTGRSGTGKELAARAIHAATRARASGPFVAVNCAAIPEALFESAMFGHRRGAFTDAHDSHVGLIERSAGGTLFLDEVGDIPVPQQAKLLRVLQESELTPVGATRPVKVDLRVVAATNRNLEAMVRCGEFREDLYYRINVVRIHMPELSERPGDIPSLSEHLLAEIAREHGGPPAAPGQVISPEALEALSRHRWQGNVRELRNVLERASIAARGRRIEVSDLPLSTTENARVVEPALPAALTLAEAEKAHLEKVLALCNGNRTTAARVLGIDRRTLLGKLQRHGLVARGTPTPWGDTSLRER